ncbi:MAG: ribosomal RNA small subunit methyltransferase A [Pirellulaceae bacterium]|nr:ribosomal RNA small subunit methyltransferase A [Pirellulaceae bacterium]
MSQRQTLTYLSQRLESVGIEPKTRFGQNFLIDLNLVELIARSAQLTSKDVVLEVGTGMGSLTRLLAAQAAHVVTVEIDSHIAPLAREEFAEFNNVTLLERDARKNKSQFDPVVLETLREKLAAVPGGKLKLVANLPYNVATPIISNLLSVDPWPTRIVVTIQKELADRIVAEPRTKDYGALSIWIQAQAKAQIVRVMPPSVFWPRPKVDSAIVDIRTQSVLRKRIVDVEFFHNFVRSTFLHRRKFLRSALIGSMKDHLDKSAIDEILAKLEIRPDCRAEQLSVEEMIDLAAAALPYWQAGNPNAKPSAKSRRANRESTQVANLDDNDQQADSLTDRWTDQDEDQDQGGDESDE